MDTLELRTPVYASQVVEMSACSMLHYRDDQEPPKVTWPEGPNSGSHEPTRKEQSNHPVILNKGHLLYHHTQPNCGYINAVPAGKAFSDRKWRDRISDTRLLVSSSVIKQLRALRYFGHYGNKRQPKTVLDGFVSFEILSHCWKRRLLSQ